jgi:hypothetical protein
MFGGFELDGLRKLGLLGVLVVVFEGDAEWLTFRDGSLTRKACNAGRNLPRDLRADQVFDHVLGV